MNLKISQNSTLTANAFFRQKIQGKPKYPGSAYAFACKQSACKHSYLEDELAVVYLIFR